MKIRKEDLKSAAVALLVAFAANPFLSGVAANEVSNCGKAIECLSDGWEFRADGGSWRRVRVPHDWSIESAPAKGGETGKEWGFYKAGKGEYRRTFEIAEADLVKHLELAFDGVFRFPEVYVNGKLAGKGTRYGYTGFRIPLDGKVKAGKNDLLVKVDNSALPGSRWYMGSGIYRGVRLEKMAYPYVEPLSVDVRTKLLSDGSAEVAFTWWSVEPPGSAHLKVENRYTRVIKNPVLWTPETPKLYEQEIGNGVKVRFGIRTVEWSAEKGFLLNGKPVEMHGACVHHDHGPLGAASEPEFEYRKARQLKEAGFNAVRTSHNPVSEEFLSACDELGLLVMDDMFDGRERKKTNGDYCEVFKDDWRRDVEWIVRRDRVHPSVVMWSVGNEILERSEPFAAETTKQMHELIDRLDGTRPVTQALCLWGEKWEDQDAMAANLDIVGYNYLEHFTESDHARLPKRVIVYTETYPKDAAMVWNRIVKHPYVIGEFVWTGIDYLGETGIGRNFYTDRELHGEHWQGHLPQFPWHGAYCGDIDLTGHRKPISHYRETLWNPGAKTYLAVREPDGWKGKIATSKWSVWPTHDHWTFAGWEGKKVTVEVYSRRPKVELYLNGRLVGAKDVSAETAWKAEFELDYAPGELTAVGIAADGSKEKCTLMTAGEPKDVRFSHCRIGRYDWITAEVVDANGTVCPYADREVDFGAASLSGEVVATCSGDLSDNVPAPSATRRTWMGRAMAVVRK